MHVFVLRLCRGCILIIFNVSAVSITNYPKIDIFLLYVILCKKIII